jgi:hypothetical protein
MQNFISFREHPCGNLCPEATPRQHRFGRFSQKATDGGFHVARTFGAAPVRAAPKISGCAAERHGRSAAKYFSRELRELARIGKVPGKDAGHGGRNARAPVQ